MRDMRAWGRRGGRSARTPLGPLDCRIDISAAQSPSVTVSLYLHVSLSSFAWAGGKCDPAIHVNCENPFVGISHPERWSQLARTRQLLCFKSLFREQGCGSRMRVVLNGSGHSVRVVLKSISEGTAIVERVVLNATSTSVLACFPHIRRPFRFPTERGACHDAGAPGRRPLMRDLIAAGIYGTS